jgi:hypothetical protein
VVHKLFEDGAEMDFFVLALSIRALRMFVNSHGVDGNVTNDEFGPGNKIESIVMNKDKFLAAYKTLPPLIQQLMDTSYVPTQLEVETAAYSIRGKTMPNEEAFLGSLNNLVFLEKSQKSHKMHKMKHRTKSPTQT